MRALLDAWKEDLRYRISRVKARMKFMVDDRGPEGMREEVERRLGYALPDFTLEPLDHDPADHMGVEPEHEAGLSSVGAPVHLGLISGDQMLAVAELAAEPGPRHPPDAPAEPRRHRDRRRRPRDVADARPRSASRSTPTGCASNAIGCTGEPHCNFAVAETKGRLGALIEHLERRFGDEVSELRLHLDGCPHACGQHWVGDLGFQGTTVRDAEGKRHQGYDVLLRGALGPVAAIGRPVFRRVPTEELDETVERLIVAWLEGRIVPSESFRVVLRPHRRTTSSVS